MTVHDLFPSEALMEQFIQECCPQGTEQLFLEEENVVAIALQEVTNHYGQEYMMPVPMQEFSMEEVQRWIDLQYDLEYGHLL